jgi:peptide/nickel transport system permease protein
MTAFFKSPAWQRLKRNKGAMAGLAVILISVIVAVFCYFIAPDPSPYSNRIILETGGEKPGFTKQFIQIKK